MYNIIMELIIKPTSACNFNCTFCSAACLSLLHQTHVTKQLKDILNVLCPNSIIITGGEPLLVPIGFYEELLSLGEWDISLTSNLKDFYHNPAKWTLLFRNPRVKVITSFQYGNGRLWDEHTVYDENMFTRIFKLFNDEIGYKLKFISVISLDNEHYALKHVQLANALKTQCKINGQMPLGKSTDFYPLHKLIKIWLDAIDCGYSDSLCMQTCFNGGCNLNTSLLCQSTIRSFAVNSDGKILYSSCEDDLTNGITISIDEAKPTPNKEHIHYSLLITNECLYCELYYVCNGCKQYRALNKKVSEHCENMKKLKSRILKTNWRLLP